MTYDTAGSNSHISTANAKQFLIFIFFGDSGPEVLSYKKGVNFHLIKIENYSVPFLFDED